MSEQPTKNTDRELWRGPDEGNGSFYADSIHVTKDGGIGINCGGMVYVKPLREWHRLATQPARDAAEGADATQAQRSAMMFARSDVAAPPKPAPDAMRTALQKLVNEVAGVWDAFEFGIRAEISNTNYTCVQERLNEAEAILRDRSSAPVPPADDPEAPCAPMRFQNEVDAEGFTVSAKLVPVPPADGAQEPFAWVVLSDVTGNTRMWTRNGDIAKAFAAKHLLKCIELYAAPPVRGDRAEVLRLLQASSCFRGEVCSSLPCACADSLADLSLPVQPGAGERP